MANFSNVDICNMALAWVGQQSITRMDEDSEAARKCNVFFEPMREAMLEEHEWSFATKRSPELAASATEPEFGYSYYYPVPADCLRVFEMSEEDTYPWVQEAMPDGTLAIATDVDSDVYVRYVYTIEDPVKFTRLFIEAFALRLASMLAIAIVGNRALSEQMEVLYKDKLRMAIKHDLKTDSTSGVYSHVDTSWQDAGR